MERPKLPADDPYSLEAEEARAERELDRAKRGAASPIAQAIEAERVPAG